MSNQITEITKIDYIHVYNKGCIGCQRHKKKVMLTAVTDDQMYDIFLTQEQALRLLCELSTAIEFNTKYTVIE